MTKDPFQWNDGEVVFCAGLVALGGVPAVPHASIPAYLQLQIGKAAREGEQGAVDELRYLLDVYHTSSLIEAVVDLLRAGEVPPQEIN